MPTTFANTINGNEILAKRSQCDYAGNDIQTMYATKSELPTATSDLTNDSGFITLSDVPAQVNADWDASSGVAQILNKPSIPSYTAGKGIDITSNVVSAKVDGTTIDTNASGELTVIGGGGGGSQVNSDWDATSGVAEILNKPVPKTLTAGTGISITDGVSTVTISSNVTAPVQDVTVNGSSVVSNGVAAITITTPTVDQTYDASSANAQSGVAVAEGISDAIGDLPTNLTAAQIQSFKESLGIDETALWSGELGQITSNGTLSLSETPANFENIRFEYKCSGGARYVYETVPVRSNASDRVLDFTASKMSIGGTNDFALYIDRFLAFVYTSTPTTLNYYSNGQRQSINGSTVSNTASRGIILYKIVGIHRVASN